MLSEVGVARREAGLAWLRGVVKRRGRRRVAVRAGGALAASLAVVAAVMMTRSGAHGSRFAENTPGPVRPEATPYVTTVPDSTASPVGLRIAGIDLVRTDPRVFEASLATDGRVLAELAPVARVSVERIDDQGLQRALRAAGEPAGIVRIGRRVMTEGEFAQDGRAGS